MRQYEVIFLINPNWCGFINSIILNYKNIILNNNGFVHHIENMGCFNLAYSIKNVCSAFYIILYIECEVVLMQSLVKSLKFNEAVLRSLVIRKKSDFKHITDKFISI